MDYECQCCKATASFESENEAFEQGWDVAPMFASTTCSLCPSFYVHSGLEWRHNEIHSEWERLGRPEEFSQEDCLLPEDRFEPEAVAALAEKIGADPRFEKRLVNSMIMAIRKEQEPALKRLNRWVKNIEHSDW